MKRKCLFFTCLQMFLFYQQCFWLRSKLAEFVIWANYCPITDCKTAEKNHWILRPWFCWLSLLIAMLLTWHLKLTKLVEICKNSFLYFQCNPKTEITIRKVTQESTKSKPILSSLVLTILMLLLTSLLTTSSPIFRTGLEDTERKMMLNRAARSFSIVFLLLTTQTLLEQIRCQWRAANYLENTGKLSKKMTSLFI